PRPPHADEVVGMKARLYQNPAGRPDIPEFIVPAAEIRNVMNWLSPAVPYRSKEVVGELAMIDLELALKAGQTAHITIYRSNQGTVRFSMGHDSLFIVERNAVTDDVMIIDQQLRRIYQDSVADEDQKKKVWSAN